MKHTLCTIRLQTPTYSFLYKMSRKHLYRFCNRMTTIHFHPKPMAMPSSPSAPAPLPAPPLDSAHDATGATLELCGYDADSGTFLLCATAEAASSGSGKRSRPESYLRRELADFQRWDRQLARAQQEPELTVPESALVLSHDPSLPQPKPTDQQQPQEAPPPQLTPFDRLPVRRLRKLMAQNWLKHDVASGWRLELQKNVTASEKWLNDAFARLSVAHQCEFLHTEQYQQRLQERADARAQVQHARGLQQYFTSQALVDRTLERVATFLSTQCPDEATPLASDRFVWLEPSCGDGRFVASLLQAGATHVVGIELDSALCGDARAAIQAFGTERTVEIREGDFLTSRRACSRVVSSGNDADADGTQRSVVVVGNPPFGDKMDGAVSTDLIQRFVAHAAGEWRAAVIAFIVPERCGRAAYKDLTLATLTAACDGAERSSADEAAAAWRLASAESLDGFRFEFGGTKRIKQPSVLLMYARI